MAEKKQIDIVYVACISAGIFAGLLLVRVVLGMGGVLGGALGGGLGAALGIGFHRLIGSRKQ